MCFFCLQAAKHKGEPFDNLLIYYDSLTNYYYYMSGWLTENLLDLLGNTKS